MTEISPPKPRRTPSKHRPFIDNAGHMNPDHVERLRQLGGSSEASEEPAFLHDLTESEQELADSLGEETVANMTSGQQQPMSPGTLEDLADLSIDAPAEDVEDDVVEEPLLDAAPRRND